MLKELVQNGMPVDSYWFNGIPCRLRLSGVNISSYVYL